MERTRADTPLTGDDTWAPPAQGVNEPSENGPRPPSTPWTGTLKPRGGIPDRCVRGLHLKPPSAGYFEASSTLRA